jgi:hypothetical protein
MAKMYRVYSIIERPKQEDFWRNIGVAFRTKKATASMSSCRPCRCTAMASS